VPLALSAFTHLWNPIGFPTFFIDESGYYMSRAMHFLETGNPKDEFPRFDHPYFGWIFLGGVLAMFGYPDSLNPSSDVNSVQMLYLYPRILMGILAVADTFLIYKISQARYNTSVAFIASLLFAVMPLTWVNRRILLDSIQLPFLLSSILFALYYVKYGDSDTRDRMKRTLLFPLLSGIFMGLALFTKLPAVTMIPLVCFLIYSSTRKNIWIQDKPMMIWLCALILIALIWPAHALSIGQFDQWKSGVLYHIDREDQPLSLSLENLFRIDPVLMTLGIAGLVYAALKKDFLILLWSVPLLAFLQFVGYVSFFHLIPLFPVFCIAASRLAVDLYNKIRAPTIRRMAGFIFVIAVGSFGLISTTLLVTQNLTSSFFELSSFVAEAVPDKNADNNNTTTSNMTVIGHISFLWIPKYVLDKDNHSYQSYWSWQDIKNRDVLLLVDSHFKGLVFDNNRVKDHDQDRADDWHTMRLKNLYEKSHEIAFFEEEGTFNRIDYPYTGDIYHTYIGIGRVEIRSNTYDIPMMLKDNGYMLEPIFNGLKFPTSMAFLGPDDILVLEKNDGTVRRVVNGTMLPEPVLDVNVANTNERGMLGIAISKPNDNNNNDKTDIYRPTYVFLYYTEAQTMVDDEDLAYENSSNATTNSTPAIANTDTTQAMEQPLGNRLYRYEFINGKLMNPKLLLDLPALPGPSRNGGAVAIGPDNNVYVTVGDLMTRNGNNSTTAANIIGASDPDGRSGILRVTQDGEIVGTGILGEEHPINKYYAYGIRNSFGIDFDPVTGKLWDTEDDPTSDGELNLVEPGFNSGWKKIQGMEITARDANSAQIATEPDGLVTFNGTGKYSSPELVWNYSAAATALKFMNSDQYGEQYKNDLVVAEYNQRNIYNFDLNQNRTEVMINSSSLEGKIIQNRNELEDSIFIKTPGGITDMELGPDGYLYILSSIQEVETQDCTLDRNQNCLDYSGFPPITGGIFKVVPVPPMKDSE
jgi:glucose/arabinose dehydrogenase